MKIGVLTYATHHLKTEQVVSSFIHEKDFDLKIYALPFLERKKRMIRCPHRPDMAIGAHPGALAKYYDIPFQAISDVNDIRDEMDYCVIAGAGILAGEFLERVKVINCHPGLQPSVRGLDAFKWAIADQMPLGCSLHVIDKEVDAGQHLKSLRTPVYLNDTYETLARRHYENEIVLLCNFMKYVTNPEPYLEGLEERPARLRMPSKTEEEMIAKFPEYINKYALCES